ncbi:MAG: toxic anion resistance protein [Candidatus Niyogibacteria bacterium]|nr:toxic anion resistance protein [Candidatus Niyogibacteria bacterium]
MEAQIALKERQQPLVLNLDVVKAQEVMVIPQDVKASVGPAESELNKRANEFVETLLAMNPEDIKGQRTNKDRIESMGRDLQRQAAYRSQMLKNPIRTLSAHGDDGGEVANTLIALREQVEKLDPAKFDLSPGWLSRMLGFLPGIGKPLKRYFMRFESAQTIIDAIINSLEKGSAQLDRDNEILRGDQDQMRELTIKIEKQIQLGQIIDQKLQTRLESGDIAEADPRFAFIQEELLFPLKQRIMDLQQQLAVNQQGVLAVEIIIRNNLELIRGVNRAHDVTINALNVAVAVAIALAHQKIVLDKITALNATTSKLIEQTAQQLRTQGTAIHKQAAGSMLDMESLKRAFTNISGAMDEISRYRREALPKMSQAILDFNRMTDEGEEAIQKMEQGNRARPAQVDVLNIQ